MTTTCLRVKAKVWIYSHAYFVKSREFSRTPSGNYNDFPPLPSLGPSPSLSRSPSITLNFFEKKGKKETGVRRETREDAAGLQERDMERKITTKKEKKKKRKKT